MTETATDLQRAQLAYKRALAAADRARATYIDALHAAADDGMTLAEIGAELGGLNKSTVSRLLSRAGAARNEG